MPRTSLPIWAPGPAIIAHRDDGTRRELDWQGLRDLVSRLSQALAGSGVGPGDRVAAIVTNDIEAIACAPRDGCARRGLGLVFAGFRTGWRGGSARSD